MPLAETTVDSNNGTIYVISFPDRGQPTLYTLDYALNIIDKKVTTNLEYFDLQYSEPQDAFYGIVVNGTYGRVLSHFLKLDTQVLYTPIGALPYMWYVNASTFDPAGLRYFGLLNYFPVSANATKAQKLAVASVREAPGTVRFVDLAAAPGTPAGVLHFIAWSQPSGALVGVMQAETTVHFVVVDPVSGSYTTICHVEQARVGPLTASLTLPVAYAFLTDAAAGRVLVHTSLASPVAKVVKRYGDFDVTVGVARMDPTDGLTTLLV